MSDTRALKLLPVLSACLCILSAGCGGGGSSANATYTVGGTASGISAGSSVVLTNDGSDIATVSADGAFTFPTPMVFGGNYLLAILTNPTGEICSISGFSHGIITTSSVSNILVTCNPTAATVTTFAGFAGVGGSADGAGTSASFSFPVDIASDTAGNLYVSDSTNRTIRKISTTGTVTTLAGSPGVIGSTDDTGAAASFSLPTGIAVDASGNVYVVDTGNQTIRKITPAGVVTTVAGTARVAGSADGTGAAARFNTPASVAVDTNGNLYVTDRGNNTIRMITPAGVVSTLAGVAGVAGTADGTGTGALFQSPIGIAVDASNNIYVGDGSNTIRKITSGAVVTTLAGIAGLSGAGDGPTTASTFNGVSGIAVDTAGNLYVADQSNNAIRKVAPDGTVSMLAGTAGTPGAVDGNAGAARFNNPTGITVDPAGKVYVVDHNNQTIRKITP